MLQKQQTMPHTDVVPQLNFRLLRSLAIVIALASSLWTSNLAFAQTDDTACIVSTSSSNTVRVRVGPGEHRTSVTYLDADTEFSVLSEYKSDDGDIWYRLDKDEAAPSRAINEAWINASDVETDGDCEDLDSSSAPPIIPIMNHSTPDVTHTESGSDAETVADDGHITISEGMWHVQYALTTNTSCEDMENVEISTYEWFGFEPNFTAELVMTETGFVHGGLAFSYIGDNTYLGTFNDGSLTGTVYLTATDPHTLVGRYIDSGFGCSATTGVTLIQQ